jgi:hypothetical protein
MRLRHTTGPGYVPGFLIKYRLCKSFLINLYLCVLNFVNINLFVDLKEKWRIIAMAFEWWFDRNFIKGIEKISASLTF